MLTFPTPQAHLVAVWDCILPRPLSNSESWRSSFKCQYRSWDAKVTRGQSEGISFSLSSQWSHGLSLILLKFENDVLILRTSPNLIVKHVSFLSLCPFYNYKPCHITLMYRCLQKTIVQLRPAYLIAYMHISHGGGRWYVGVAIYVWTNDKVF